MVTAIIIKVNKSIIFGIFFLTFFAFYIGAESVDIIALVDTSSSMESCFDDVIVYLLDDVLSTRIQKNDTFHLIQFSGTPVHELTLKIKNKESLSLIIKEILFLHEKVLFGRYTDVVMALEGLYLFVADLSPLNKKKIFFITDIQHDPPSSSPYSNRDPELVKYALSRNTRVLREKNGWYVLSIEIPENTGFSYATDKTIDNLFHNSTHEPAHTNSNFSKENTDTNPLTELVHVLGIGDKNFRDNSGNNSQSFGGDSPLYNIESLTDISREQNLLLKIFLIFLCAVVIIILILFLIIFKRKKKLEGSFKDIFDTGKWQENLVSFFSDDIPLIEMKVSFQNPHIGFRNIHKVKDNKRMSIGGGLSHYLIFLIPMPPNIAELYKEDGKYIFKPVQKEYFPDIDGPVVNCLDKEIPVVSRHGYKSMIVFREYTSPLTQLHTLLHSITYDAESTKDLFHTHKLALSAIVSKEVM